MQISFELFLGNPNYAYSSKINARYVNCPPIWKSYTSFTFADLHSCLGCCFREFVRSTTAQLAKRTWPEAAEKLVSGEAQASDMCLCEDGKTLESLIGLNQPQIPWSTCKGSNMKCQCQSFSTPSSMKPGTSGD